MRSFAIGDRAMRLRDGALALSAALFMCLTLFTAQAAAENWEQVGTVNGSSFTVGGVNASGTVAVSTSTTAYRWTSSGGIQPIGNASPGCSLSIAGISDEGVILGTEFCAHVEGDHYVYVQTLLAWTPESANPITPIAGTISAKDIAPNGKFIATNHQGTGLNPNDDTVITGEANVAPVTGALLFGSAPAGAGYGISIAPDGTTLTGKQTGDGFVPPEFSRDGSPSGPFFVRSSETYEEVFGLTPDERALARVAGNSSDPDPATDINTMKLLAYDRTTPTEVPLTGGGLTITPNQTFLPGGFGKSIYATGTGTGVPEGEAAIVAWTTPGSTPHTLPMYFETTQSGQPLVKPAASSYNGAYLVLSNGEVWYDTEWELGNPPEGALKIPDQVKRYAFDQQQFYEGQIGYWQTKQKVALVGIGPIASFSPAVLAALAVGVVGQGTEFTVAIQNRDYWATVSLDPPDPKWKTVASAPKTHPGKLKRPKGVSKAAFGKVTAYLGARLTLLANHICAEDAINRGSTAFGKDNPAKGRAQYAAGAQCSKRAAAAALSSKRLAAKAAPVIDRALLGIRRLKGKKNLSKAGFRDAVEWQIGQINRLIDLPPALKGEFKELLTKIDKPIDKKKVSSIRRSITKAADHDGGTAGKIHEVGDAFEEAAG
mgnify:CR=1 FL=1